ncbi:MAG TPA: hypothetical protein VGH33_16250, partial [Isosphaeraceae bacterium]
MNRLRFTGAGLARSVGLLLLLGQPSSPARGDDQPKEATAPAAAAPAPAPVADPTSSPAAPDPTGASYYGPGVSTTGALTKVDGKVTPLT